jgi:signal transduction histidine kinase
LSAVALNASAALSVPDLDRAKVAGVLELIRENGVQGLAELRRLVGLLREGAEDPLRHGLADLPTLVSQARDGGLAVELRSTGEPVALPVDVDLAAYRIVQESLTNARKHGAGPAVDELAFDFRYLSIAVDNPMGSGSPLPGSGTGLVGMRERAEILGGEFRAGREGSLWRVHARLPIGVVS